MSEIGKVVGGSVGGKLVSDMTWGDIAAFVEQRRAAEDDTTG